MDSRLKELREKIVLVDALIHEDDCESKDVHSTRCKASGEVLGLFDALFPSPEAAGLPEPAPGEGSPSPSVPAQPVAAAQKQPAEMSLSGKRMHRLKCHPQPFAALLAKTKTFEWRAFDRDYQIGDILILNEWDPEPEAYTGICVHREVTYLLSEGFGIPAGYCVMGIKPYPDPIPTAGATPSHPSGPSQDSQEVREALARLEAYCKALHEQGDYDGHLPWDESTERRDYVLIRDILLSALLSQSPKGAAGAREWVLMVENETGHIACGWKEMPKGVHSQPMSGCRYVRVREVLAAAPSPTTAGDGHPDAACLLDRDHTGPCRRDGDAEPSAPKTGLRGAARLEDISETQEAGRVILDLCTAVELLIDVGDRSQESEAKRAWRNGCRWLAGAPPEAPQAPLSEAKGPDLPPSSQPAPGDVGDAGGSA